mmetsp:Transcript_11003/g.25142  ORF Transcript_11003/g.25142 Transcript_11003/m.25142 type:complete len:310 (-) Transcript_11003:53-982(-)
MHIKSAAAFSRLLLLFSFIVATAVGFDVCEDPIAAADEASLSDSDGTAALLQSNSKLSLSVLLEQSGPGANFRFWQAAQSAAAAATAASSQSSPVSSEAAQLLQKLQQVTGQPIPSSSEENSARVSHLTHVTELVSLTHIALLYALISLITAITYKEYKKWPSPQAGALPAAEAVKQMEDWSDDLWSYSTDTSICVFSACCCPIRFADNVSRVGLSSFWCIFGIILCLMCLNIFIPAWIFTLTVCTYYRQLLRAKFNMPHSTLKIAAGDWILLCCCSSLVVAQDARHLEAAALIGHPAIVRKSGESQLK